MKLVALAHTGTGPRGMPATRNKEGARTMSGEKCRRETDWRYNHSQNGRERWRKYARKARAASGTCAYNEMHGISLPGSIRNGRDRRRRRLAAIERGDRQLAAIEAGMLPREAKRLP